MIDCAAHLGLAGACAKRFIGRGVEYEELFAHACEALALAAARYDPARGAAFSTYAVPCVLGALKRRCARERCARERAMGAYQRDEPTDESGAGFADYVLLLDTIDRLPPPMTAVLRLRFLRGRTQGCTARALGLSQAAVSRLESRARDCLRALLSSNF